MTKSYPNTRDNDFYDFINKRYSKYKIPKTQKTLQQFCFPKEFEYQLPQKFLAEFINPKTPYKGILVFHRIGAGKTCTAINIAENFKNIKTIMIVLPASLKNNFRTELRSKCAGENYLKDSERNLLKKYHPSSPEYRDIIKKSDLRIDKNYTIYSYNKFISLISLKKINLRNTLLIIDEIHNMISETGVYYKHLHHLIHNSPDDLRIVIMSATPIFDKPVEIALTMNLLLPKNNQLPQQFVNEFIDINYTQKGPKYKFKNSDVFKNYIRGFVSYYRGAPPYVYPKSELHLVRTKMSDRQKKMYLRIIKREKEEPIVKDYVNQDISNSFFIGARVSSNFIFPNGKFGKTGFDSLTDKDFDIKKFKEYSPKSAKIFKKIKKCKGTVFVYSSFKEYGGIKTFAKLLEHSKYKDYEKFGHGKKRFAIWTGDQTSITKEEIKNIFNNINNEDGSQIKIILGSPSIKEGISLLRIQEVHIMEPYWNWSRLDQIIGRAIRFCSHKDVPPDKRLVKVYIYLAVHEEVKKSIDEHIIKMAYTKKMINNEFEQALKESAIDCELFKNGNVYNKEEDYDCDK